MLTSGMLEIFLIIIIIQSLNIIQPDGPKRNAMRMRN